MWPERYAYGRAFVRRSRETYVVLLDEVLKGQVHLAVLLCDRDDDSQVRPDELEPRSLVAFPCSPAVIDLFLVRKGLYNRSARSTSQEGGSHLVAYPLYRLSCYLESSLLCSLFSSGCAMLKGNSSSSCLCKAPF